MTIKTQIQQLCKYIEKEHNVKILFCVESGSRAWNMESVDSDYDVRFVFCHNKKKYLDINKPNEIITKHLNDTFQECEAKGCYVDMCGFDIYKFMRMMKKSNPTVIEWVRSNIVYKSDPFFHHQINELMYDCFSPKALYHHYKSMCRQNYEKYVKTDKLVTYKKYLYCMRGLVNAKGVLGTKKIPVMNFLDMLDLGFIDRDIETKIREAIQWKKTGKEIKVIDRIKIFDEYIEEFLKEVEDIEHEYKDVSIQINKILFGIPEEVEQ